MCAQPRESGCRMSFDPLPDILKGRELRVITAADPTEQDKLFVSGYLTEGEKELIREFKAEIVTTVLFLQTDNRIIKPGTEYKLHYPEGK